MEESYEKETEYEESLFMSEEMCKSKHSWLIDSGATRHMTFDRESLSDFIEFKQPSPVILGDSRSILAYGKGTYRLTTNIDGRAQNIALRDVLFLPELGRNLLSVRAMTNLGGKVEFEGNNCKITRNGKMLGIGVMSGKSYFLKLSSSEEANAAESTSKLELWHCR